MICWTDILQKNLEEEKKKAHKAVLETGGKLKRTSKETKSTVYPQNLIQSVSYDQSKTPFRKLTHRHTPVDAEYLE